VADDAWKKGEQLTSRFRADVVSGIRASLRERLGSAPVDGEGEMAPTGVNHWLRAPHCPESKLAPAVRSAGRAEEFTRTVVFRGA
jgi:hypothetical protein